MATIISSLSFTCPICSAAPKEPCEMNSGTPRFESHAERRNIVKDHFLEAESLVLDRLEPVIEAPQFLHLPPFPRVNHYQNRKEK
jgi:hypothetical protein